MLNIYKSNRLEVLFEALASILAEAPPKPMVPEWISIQSRGMKQWLTIQLAQKFGICANTNFAFPKEIVALLLSSFKLLNESEKNLGKDSLFWFILNQMYNTAFVNTLGTAKKYIETDPNGKKRFQLSLKVAKVFDDYQIYRPDLLLNWEKTGTILNDISKDNIWQAMLWNQIVAQYGNDHFPSKMQMFANRFPALHMAADNLPDRFSFFGISSLPAMFIQMLEKVSQILDIHLFLLVPSNQFFLDIKSQKQMEKITLTETPGQSSDSLYFEMTNPLLASLGTAGKDFLTLLETFDYYEPSENLFLEPLEDSQNMLSYLQSDILNLVHRGNGQRNLPVSIAAGDASISIHACHSPMREAQVLKDLLLDRFEKDPELKLHDIIVMMPDIEAYAPFIESVFSLEHHLDFSISDRKKRSESHTLKAFFKILSLKNERLEKTQIIDLLLSDAIAHKFDIQTDEIIVIQKIVDDANILWGRNAEHRKNYGLPHVFQNTWEFGLQRLFLGMAMPQNHDKNIGGIYPCSSLEGIDLEILGKFSAFCDVLFSIWDMLKGEKTIGEWLSILKKVMSSLIEQDASSSEDIQFLLQSFNTIKQEASMAQFNTPVSFDVVYSYLEQKLNLKISQGNFLSGKITFCNLMPMRSIPYKIVVLMGMDEKSFPRRTGSPGFDLMKNYPRPGDKNERTEDRYLFLETLLSARSQFIITYTGISIQDNTEMPSAGVLNELCDVMEQSFNFEKKYNYFFSHPLHPFSDSYFLGEPVSYSKNNCRIAKALRRKVTKRKAFISSDFTAKSQKPTGQIFLNDMTRFFKNSFQYFMKESLDVQLPIINEITLEREPFKISGLEQYNMGQYLVDRKFSDTEHSDPFSVLEGKGILPFGIKGRLEYQRIESIANPIAAEVQELKNKSKFPPMVAQMDTGKSILNYSLSDVYQDGAYLVHYGKLNASRLLEGWIKHLFLNTCAPKNYPKETFLIGQDPNGKKPIAKVSFSPIEDKSSKYLNHLAEIFTRGMEMPLYFFCNTSWQFVCELKKSNYELTSQTLFSARHKALNTWYGSRFMAGECENRYIQYFIKNNDPFQNIDALASTGFVKNSIDIFKPMLESLRNDL